MRKNFGELRKLDRRRDYQRYNYLRRYGREGYQAAGRKGGLKSGTKFTSESARAASLKSWEVRRARQQAERDKQNEDGLSSNENN